MRSKAGLGKGGRRPPLASDWPTYPTPGTSGRACQTSTRACQPQASPLPCTEGQASLTPRPIPTPPPPLRDYPTLLHSSRSLTRSVLYGRVLYIPSALRLHSIASASPTSCSTSLIWYSGTLWYSLHVTIVSLESFNNHVLSLSDRVAGASHPPPLGRPEHALT